MGTTLQVPVAFLSGAWSDAIIPASTGSVTEMKIMGISNSLLTAAWGTEVTSQIK